MSSTWSDLILDFYRNLSLDWKLPAGYALLTPHADDDVMEYMHIFYEKFYKDHRPRILLLGINPGRLGAGVTGIPFTDPVHLESQCDIFNHLPKKQELSSVFIYELIQKYGSTTAFYNHFIIHSISPLGFVKNGINANYYDEKELFHATKPYIIDNLKYIASLPLVNDIVFSLGKGLNYTYLKQLNEELKLFKQVKALPHPRWVMQYKRKNKEKYLADVEAKLSEAANAFLHK